MVEPNREDMERAKIVLDDALPYELDMLDAAARYMQTDEFSTVESPGCKERRAVAGEQGECPEVAPGHQALAVR